MFNLTLENFLLQQISPYFVLFCFVSWGSRNSQILKTGLKLLCLETVCEVFCRCEKISCSFPGLWRENSSMSRSQAQAWKQHSPRRKGSWAEELAQWNPKHWETVGTVAVGLWENHLWCVCEKKCKTMTAKSPGGRKSQFRALRTTASDFPCSRSCLLPLPRRSQ